MCINYRGHQARDCEGNTLLIDIVLLYFVLIQYIHVYFRYLEYSTVDSQSAAYTALVQSSG